MKKNTIPILLFIAGLIFITLAFTSCGLVTELIYTQQQYMKEDVYSPTYESDMIRKFRAENDSITARQLRYSQSAEFKRIHGGISPVNELPGARANSITGTKADPFKEIRTTSIGVPAYTNTQYYDVRIR